MNQALNEITPVKNLLDSLLLKFTFSLSVLSRNHWEEWYQVSTYNGISFSSLILFEIHKPYSGQGLDPKISIFRGGSKRFAPNVQGVFASYYLISVSGFCNKKSVLIPLSLRVMWLYQIFRTTLANLMLKYPCKAHLFYYLNMSYYVKTDCVLWGKQTCFLFTKLIIPKAQWWKS